MSQEAIVFCSCGKPQSFPLPHVHDRTYRETMIIDYFLEKHQDDVLSLAVILVKIKANLDLANLHYDQEEKGSCSEVLTEIANMITTFLPGKAFLDYPQNSSESLPDSGSVA